MPICPRGAQNSRHEVLVSVLCSLVLLVHYFSHYSCPHLCVTFLLIDDIVFIIIYPLSEYFPLALLQLNCCYHLRRRKFIKDVILILQRYDLFIFCGHFNPFENINPVVF